MAEATQKAANYTAEMVDSMIEMYNEVGNDGLDDIAGNGLADRASVLAVVDFGPR